MTKKRERADHASQRMFHPSSIGFSPQQEESRKRAQFLLAELRRNEGKKSILTEPSNLGKKTETVRPTFEEVVVFQQPSIITAERDQSSTQPTQSEPPISKEISGAVRRVKSILEDMDNLVSAVEYQGKPISDTTIPVDLKVYLQSSKLPEIYVVVQESLHDMERFKKKFITQNKILHSDFWQEMQRQKICILIANSKLQMIEHYFNIAVNKIIDIQQREDSVSSNNEDNDEKWQRK